MTTTQPAPSELEQKRLELEQLFSEIKKIEATQGTPNRKTKGLVPFKEVDNSTTVQYVQVEAQLQEALAELDRYKEETKSLSDLVKQKDEAIKELKSVVDNTSLRCDKLENKEQQHLQDSDALKEEIIRLKDENQKQTKQIRDMQLDAAKKSVLGSGAGENYFFHLNNLENQLIAKDQLIVQLRDETKNLEKSVRTAERSISDLTRELELKNVTNTDLQERDNKLKLLAHQLEDMESENKVLRHVQRLKTQAIEQLSAELEIRGASDELLNSLKLEISGRDKIIATLKDELEVRIKELKKLETDLNNIEHAEETPVSMNDWFEERRVLKANISRLQVTKGRNEQEIKGLRTRITQLESRLETIIEGIRETEKLAGRHAAYMDREVKVENDNGFVAQELYEVLEKAVIVNKAKLKEKEDALNERDETLEALEKRVDVLSKARLADAKKSKKCEADLAQTVLQLRDEIEKIHKEYKDSTQKLRSENINMHKRLDRALALHAEYEELQQIKSEEAQ